MKTILIKCLEQYSQIHVYNIFIVDIFNIYIILYTKQYKKYITVFIKNKR